MKSSTYKTDLKTYLQIAEIKCIIYKKPLLLVTERTNCLMPQTNPAYSDFGCI
jgi:hypothetical protein